MELVLQRQGSVGDHTIGALSIDGAMECFTCEDVIRERPGVPVAQWKVYGQTAIPAGRYRIEMMFSPRLQTTVPHLLNVPGFEGILIHPGNTAADTEGCILPGQTATASGVGQSRAAFAALLPKIAEAISDGVEVWIQVRNPVEKPEVTT